jgi:signal transduction histidine kinase
MGRKKKENVETEIEIIRTQLEVQGFMLSRLVNELYSNIGQMMSSTKMLIGLTERNWKPSPETLLEAHETLAKAIEELRDLCRPLGTDWLHHFMFAENLMAEAALVNQEHPGLVVYSNIHLPEHLAPSFQVLLFSIVQEALHNALKHASAKKISINVVNNRQNLELSISDNGSGFIFSPDLSIGKGIQNMRLRTALLEGTIEWINRQGTVVMVRIPKKIIKYHTHGDHHSSS